MRLPKLITAAWLLKRGACKHQVMQFQTEWPQGAEVTVANLQKAQRMDLSLIWLIGQAFSHREYMAWSAVSIALLRRYWDKELTLAGYERLNNRLERDTILRAGGKAQP